MKDVHVTVATVVANDGRFLFVEEIVGSRTVLNQPAGHWEDGESLVEAAVRETLEETGWDVEPTALVGTYQHQPADLPYGFLRFAFYAEPRRHHPERALDTGIERAVWLTPGELHLEAARHRSPMVWRCVEDALAGRRYPLSLVARPR
ncbi:MAG TPA: NUDIX hydrolase [Verrucomicrobiae bacterium]|nr:NUDIX hydrolase [Verrucomicrobiae bacterium]